MYCCITNRTTFKYTTLALFGGSLGIELSCQRLTVFGTQYVFIRIELLWVGAPRLQREQRFSVTDRLDGICISETGIISNGRMDGPTNRHVGKTMFRHYIAYQRRILLGYLLITFY